MNSLNKPALLASGWLVKIGGVFLVGMIVLTCANIFLRLVWIPVRGTFELMGFFGAIVAAFALAHTQTLKGHIAVDVLLNTFSAGKKRFCRIVNSLACFLFMGLCAWQLVLKAGILNETGEVTETLNIVYYPFVYGVALGCLILALVFLSDLLEALFKTKGGA
jgi:TRAP-type C4-dicarboxylate transport system permease small subunit